MCPPATGSFDNFLEDVDYLAALQHADPVARRQYEQDGAQIAEVQAGVLKISQQEEPFDVFLCYKESDDKGQRTVDSTLAQEIYYELTEQGYRVIFLPGSPWRTRQGKNMSPISLPLYTVQKSW